MNSRREFLKSAGRNAVLAFFGIATVAGFVFKKINTEAKAACPTSPSCKKCGQITNCQKEQAKDFNSNRN
jgi:hypothetical protein